MGTKNGNKFASTIVGVTNVLGIAKILFFFLTVLI